MRDYIERGLIKETIHPHYPELAIYNYTPECQYSRAWDDTTRAARGLVLNRHTGEVIAKPWPKFFNLSEHDAIPDGPAHVVEKMDGSLGIVFHYDGRWHIATRGSFTSEQAQYAARWIADMDFPQGYTHLFEIIYPYNRIVVDYSDFEGLVYLESISLATGEPSDVVEWSYRAARIGVMRPEELPQHKDNAEGYVLYWQQHDFRVKVKFDEYVRLHKIMTEYSIKRLWEHVSSGGDLASMISGVPDEFYQEVKKDYEVLLARFDEIVTAAAQLCAAVADMPTRKEQAAYIMGQNKDLSGIVFKVLDEKDVNETIWRKVREWLNF
jgi:RNA ligase